ncbi:MAG: thioredoxin TrxC [Methylococcales bacterium]|jgi:thioredoxin 2|nr:thioredoxin TrxC [Methylococcales bacterium]
MSAQHIVCPSCQAINRIPSEKLADHPKCGKCKVPLFQALPLEVTAAQFERHISRNDIPVLVDFWAPWCGPCKMMGPAFKEAAAALEPKFRLLKLNTENEQMVGAKLNIRSIPTLAVFKGGKEEARQAGAMGVKDIVGWANQFVL